MNKAAQEWCIEARKLLDLRRPDGSSVQDATAAAAPAAARAAAMAAELKQHATRLVALRQELERVEAAKTPIGPDVAKRLDEVTKKLQSSEVDGVPKMLDQLDQLAKAVAARRGGAAAVAAQGEAKAQAREAADALLAQLNAALLAERQRLPGLTDVGLKTPIEAQLVTLEGDRDKAAKTAGDELRTAAQQGVLDAVPALTGLLDDALATQALKQAYPAGGLLAIWREAKERVDLQISQLQSFLRQTKDPRSQRIAEMGLNGVTGKLQVGLQVALTECDQAGGRDAKLGAKAAAVVTQYLQFLQNDQVIALCDENPFGVKCDIRGTLLPALTELEKKLKA
jgi:hypothetical protein